jgi:hypothetical protein
MNDKCCTLSGQDSIQLSEDVRRLGGIPVFDLPRFVGVGCIGAKFLCKLSGAKLAEIGDEVKRKSRELWLSAVLDSDEV